MTRIIENTVEEFAIELLERLGYQYIYAPDIAPDLPVRGTQTGGKYRDRSKEILFIDARHLGHLINRRTLVLSEEDIETITNTYHNWRCKECDQKDSPYEDVKGFCNAASIERVKELDYVLTPGRYVGLAEEKDDFDFKERFTSLKAEFEEQLKEETVLNKRIAENLAKIELPEFDGSKADRLSKLKS